MENQCCNLEPVVSIVLPCRNEEESIETCLKKIMEIIPQLEWPTEVIISDSSSDKSKELASAFDIRIVNHDKVGYGLAYLEGFKAVRGNYIFMADVDCSYDFEELPRFIRELTNGHDLVIGNRLKGKIEKGAMPFLNRHFGTPGLSFICGLLFKTPITDINCGMRAITRQALDQLELKGAGMDFASEMIIKAAQQKMKIKELPINYHKRRGQSKLKPIRDGFRHLGFMIHHFINFKLYKS